MMFAITARCSAPLRIVFDCTAITSPCARRIDRIAASSRAGFEMGGVIYVDQITAVRHAYDRKKSQIVSMSIGDDRDKHDPVARAIRAMQALYMGIGAIFGEGTIFG